jgi:putative nucleotidyltransferase with HDIG domain
MGKKAILFVDDEPNILAGIKRMLRSMRNEFDFFFAESGEAALSLMEQNTIDIVVSDMRMPVMDGADFLARVQQRFPQAIRLMLTGQADDESVIKTVSVVHQFLAKPCDPDRLKDVLSRSGALHDVLSNSYLKEVISSIGTLPSLPQIYARLQSVLKDPDVMVEDVAEIIAQDIAMTAKLLQLVNSSFFGLYKRVESPERAVTLLGIDTIRVLVLGVQIFSEIKIDPSVVSLESLWHHSMAVAQCSRKIAMDVTEDKDIISNCFIAGMLHDIGRLLLLSKMSEGYLPLVERVATEDLELLSEENRMFSASHCDVGAYLIGLWGFNIDIVEAIAFHHDPASYLGDSFSPTLAVHAANALYHAQCPGSSIGKPSRLNLGYLMKLGFGDRVEEWSELCRSVMEES